MHSIVSQGKVDAVLASRPEDRRALVEEAAGLGKFKRRRHRAELKLARVATQVERARDVEDEVRKRLRPLALQATAAERAEKLAGRDRRPPGADRAESTSRRSTSGRSESGGAPHGGRARPAVDAGAALVRPRRPRARGDRSSRMQPARARRRSARSIACRAPGSVSAFARSPPPSLAARLRDDLAEAERAQGARTDDDAVRALELAAERQPCGGSTAAAESGHAAERARHAHALVRLGRASRPRSRPRPGSSRCGSSARPSTGARRAHGRLRRREPRARGARRGARADRCATRERRGARVPPRGRARGGPCARPERRVQPGRARAARERGARRCPCGRDRA